MDCIFENYGSFINEHNDSFSTPKGVARLLSDDGMFRSFVEGLVDGLEESVRPSVINVLNRQRYSLLQEAATGANFATGWTVSSFPILTDIYSEPLISELANVYPIDKPQISIPRIRVKASTTSYDGNTVTTKYIPSSTDLIRAGEVDVDIEADTAYNLFVAASVDQSLYRMNRRYVLVDGVTMVEDDGDESTDNVSTDISLNLRPDNRSQIFGEFTFKDAAEVTIAATIQGNINFDTGVTSLSVVTSGGTEGHTYTCDSISLKLRFTPVGTMNGRTKVTVEQSNTDVTIDPNEDFMLDVSAEDIQDYESIFKIDIIRTISEAIKRQIALNKDYDLAYFLAAAETDINSFGAKNTLDFSTYTTAASSAEFTPANIIDIFKSVIPQISALMGTVRKNFNMYPTYMVAGLKTAAILRSLQQFSVSMPNLKGGVGFNGDSAQFSKLKVLESTVVNDSKIYLSTKAPANGLEKTSIVDLVYKPLYIQKEVTDGQTRHYVRSRTMVDVLRADGLGLLELSNVDKYLS